MKKEKDGDFLRWHTGFPKQGILVTLLCLIANQMFGKDPGDNVSAVYGTYPQEITVTGTVLDKDGVPLIGVNVLEKDARNGTSTDFDGNFSLTVKQTPTVLVFSYVGFATVEQTVTDNQPLSVTMEEDMGKLDEVVVIGYGTQKKKDLTGAVSRANLEDFREAPVTNMGQLLQGNVPGLNVGQVNSAGSTPSISIRGRSTINGKNDVLIVLDGIQYNGSLESINPNDIASIDVLKDASSTAVYGAQAANGVILITTKDGGRNRNPKITISASYTAMEPTTNLRPLKRQAYLDRLKTLYYEDAYLGPDYTQPNPAFDYADYIDPTMLDSEQKLVNTDFDWWDAGTNTGFINEQKVSVTGGSEKTSYLISLEHTDQEGFIVGDKFQRKGARVNLNTQATDWWKVGVQSFASFVKKDGAEPKMSDLVRSSPMLSPYDDEGNLIPSPFNSLDLNPFLASDIDDMERHDYFFANFFSEIQFPFLEGLSYRVNFGNNYRINRYYRASEYAAGFIGEAYKNQDFYYDYTLDNIINYKKTFGKHSIDATFVYGAIERKFEKTTARATGFSRMDLGFNGLDQGANQFTNSEAWSEALNYQMARVNYKFDERYLITGTIRRDGFSGFSEDNKFSYFPSVAVAWNIDNESFFNEDWVDNLKLRAGYGISGNQTDRYKSLARVLLRPAYVFGDGGSTEFGQQLNSLANNNLRWEKTAGINIGIDFAILKSRIQGTAEFYHSNTNDLLFDVAIPDITGFETISTNIGKIENQGFELTLSTHNIRSEGFNWHSTFNFSTNSNKIKELIGRDADGDGIEDDLISSNLFIGKSIGAIYGYQTDGLYQIGDDIPDGYFPGTRRIIDQNGDGTITPADDRVILGRTEPAYRFSVLNTFKYKGLSLRVFINAIQGGKNGYMDSSTNSIFVNDNAVRYNWLNDIDYWSPANPGGDSPVFRSSPVINPEVYRSRSFVRLQDVSLSYQFDKNIIEKLGMDELQIFVSGKNLATWTKWKGWDPEPNEPRDRRLSIEGRPVLKSYSLGLNITF
ncbi:SusC/RagA family TonB-linked outer membrane protein [Sinomicrobium oceani]|uniref:SusC/RagA family TonB-linked outer membrane protein n=1 Tax=Sinomicrobium oceani TaxID=1150368 RepID=UPI00227BBA91|nr:TonB-dependent receptor [Sinomicrobium oceani]